MSCKFFFVSPAVSFLVLQENILQQVSENTFLSACAFSPHFLLYIHLFMHALIACFKCLVFLASLTGAKVKALSVKKDKLFV